MNLKKLHQVVKKWLYLKNMNRLDLIMAVHLSRMMPGTKLWVIFIGGSGASKSELLRPLDDEENTTYILQEITGNTLVSGNPMAQDLAPMLDKKTVLILDMAILLNLRREEKAKIWGQLRELYDGNAGKNTGSGKKGFRYKGLNITLLACSTNVLDDQILIHQSLGTRELIYRVNPIEEKQEEENLMQKVINNDDYENKMRIELVSAYSDFLKDRKVTEIEIPKNSLETIKNYVRYLRIMRTTPQFDSYSGDLLSTAEPESPTRVLKQFIRLFKCLKSLDPEYTDEKALEIIKEVRDGSCNRDRVSIIKTMARGPDDVYSIHQISQRIRLGKSTIIRHLNVLWNLKLIDRQLENFDDNQKWNYKWKLNQNHSVSKQIIDEVKQP